MNPEPTPAPAAEPVATPKAPTLNSNIPLSQQTGQILKMMDNIPEKVAEPDKGDSKDNVKSPEPAPAKDAEPKTKNVVEDIKPVYDDSIMPDDDEPVKH